MSSCDGEVDLPCNIITISARPRFRPMILESHHPGLRGVWPPIAPGELFRAASDLMLPWRRSGGLRSATQKQRSKRKRGGGDGGYSNASRDAFGSADSSPTQGAPQCAATGTPVGCILELSRCSAAGCI